MVKFENQRANTNENIASGNQTTEFDMTLLDVEKNQEEEHELGLTSTQYQLLKANIEENNQGNEVSPDKINEIGKQMNIFLADCAVALQGLHYLESVYRAVITAYPRDMHVLRARLETMSIMITNLEHDRAEPLLSVAETNRAGDISIVDETTKYFNLKREKYDFKKITNSKFTLTGSFSSSGSLGGAIGKTKNICDFIKSVFTDKVADKGTRYYEEKKNELNQRIYDDMAGFWSNILGSSNSSRSYAGKLQEDLFTEMIGDEEILEEIQIPSLFYYYLPVDQKKYPTADITLDDGEVRTCSFQLMKKGEGGSLLCHMSAWYTTGSDGQRIYEYTRPTKMNGYTQENLAFTYEKSPDGYSISEKKNRKYFLYDDPFVHGMPKRLTDGSSESCNCDIKKSDGTITLFDDVEKGLIRDAGSLAGLDNYEKNNPVEGKKLKKVVNLAASTIYFDLVKDLYQGKNPDIYPSTNSGIESFNDVNMMLQSTNGELLDQYIIRAIEKQCTKNNIQWPDGIRMPGFSQAFDAALIRVNNDPAIKNMRNVFSDTDEVNKNVVEAATVDGLLSFVVEKSKQNSQYRGLFSNIATRIGSETGLIRANRIQTGGNQSAEINRDKGYQEGPTAGSDGYGWSAVRMGDDLVITVTKEGTIVKQAPYNTEGFETFRIPLGSVQKQKVVHKQNGIVYAHMAAGKLFENGLQIFSSQVNNTTSELGYNQDIELGEKSIIENYEKSHPYWKLYTELAGTGKWNPDVHELGKNYDMAKQFAADIALMAVSGGVAGSVAMGLLRAGKGASYLARGMKLKHAVAFSRVSKNALSTNRWLRATHTTLTGLAFHPVLTTIQAGLTGESREDRWEKMSNGTSYLHSVLTMHVLGMIGKGSQALKGAAEGITMKGAAMTFGVGAEVTGLLGLNHAFEFVLPGQNTLEEADQGMAEEILHTLAMVLALRAVHLPFKPGATKGLVEKVTLTEIKGKNGPTGKIEIVNPETNVTAVFIMKEGRIEPLNDIAREMLHNPETMNMKEAEKYSPLLREVNNLYQNQGYQRASSRETTHRNLNLTEATRRELVKEEIIKEIEKQDPQEAVRLRGLSQEKRDQALDLFHEAHETNIYKNIKKDDALYNEEYGIQAQTTEAIAKKVRKANEGYDVLGLKEAPRRDMNKSLFEQGLLGEYGFIAERAVQKAVDGIKLKNRAEVALFDAFQHDVVDKKSSSFDVKAKATGLGKGAQKIERHSYQEGIENVTTNLDKANGVLTVNYKVHSGGNITKESITYRLTHPDGSISTNKHMSYREGGVFVLGFSGKAKMKDLVDIQHYIETNQSNLVKVTKDVTKHDSSYGLLSKDGLVIQRANDGKNYLWEGLWISANGPTSATRQRTGGAEMDIYGKNNDYSRNELYRMEVWKEFQVEFHAHVESQGTYQKIHEAGRSSAGIGVSTFMFRGKTHKVTYSYEARGRGSSNPDSPYHTLRVEYENIGGTGGLYKNYGEKPYIETRVYPKEIR